MTAGRKQACRPVSDGHQEQWIRVGWFIDGRGGPLQKDVVMGLRDGRISSIGAAHTGQVVTMDLSHAAVLPTLMDAHVHLAFSGSMDSRRRFAQLQYTCDQIQAAVVDHLRDHWRCGVVAVRDGGDRNGEVLRCKKQNRLSAGAPVHVAVAGWAWHARGRYGSMIGRYPAEGTSLFAAVAGSMRGIDHLKVIQSGLNSIDRFGHPSKPQFSESDLCAIVKLAHAEQLPVMVHANGEVAVRMAVVAGCDSIEHGYFMGVDNLRRMADARTCWVPTVIPMATLAEAPGLTAHQQDTARRTMDHQLAQIQKAKTLGVPIALGTDAGSQGVDHGIAVRQELALLMAAGLSVEEAVHCATYNAARLLGLVDHGELVPGARADFIVVPGPPEALPERLSSISAMLLNGVPRGTGGAAPDSQSIEGRS